MTLEECRQQVVQHLKNFHAYCYDYTENGGHLDNELEAIKVCLDSMFSYIQKLEYELKKP